MIRVLLAEDSPVTERMLTVMLDRDPDITVEAVTRDGDRTIDLARRLRPDLIALDLSVPGIDPADLTRRIMENRPTPIILLAGTSTESPGHLDALDAMRAGAMSVIQKPRSGSGSTREDFAAKLTREVKVLHRVRPQERASSQPQTSPSPSRPLPPRSPAPISMIGIGASTGGPQALSQVLSALPRDLPAPILVVQHIAAGFVTDFAQWLDSICALTVRVAVGGEIVQPGNVYVAPEGTHLGIFANRRIRLSTAPKISGHRPSADFLFSSLAKTLPRQTLGILLTGMGEDGAEGLLRLKQARGTTFAQDQESCIVFGMPEAAARLGAADQIIPLGRMAPSIMEVAHSGKSQNTSC